MADELVELVAFSTSAEASIVRGTLEAAGIPAVLHGEAVAGWFWQLDAATGGVRVMVFRDQLEKAREFLASTAVEFPDPSTYEGAVGLDPDESDFDEEFTDDEKVDDLARVWRASIIGIFFFPPLLSVYSLWMLIRGKLLFDERTRNNWRGPAALVINCLVIVCTALVWTFMFLPRDLESEPEISTSGPSGPLTVPFYEEE